MMDFSQAAPVAKTLEEAQEIIEMLWKLCGQMQAQIIRLESRVKELEAQVNKNSQNSSKPPSSDAFKNPIPKNLREKSGKKPGGQWGHKRNTLEQVSDPEEIIIHPLDNCTYCHCTLKDVEVIEQESRQVFDIPVLKIEVTEHRIEKKSCPRCRETCASLFPDEINQFTQYGSRIKSLSCYLNQYQYLPYERLRECIKDIFNHGMSLGMLVKISEECYEKLESTEEVIKQKLQMTKCMHHDESGVRVKGKLHWCFVASTPQITSYGIHAKRGKTGIESMGILNTFKGRLIHDFFKPYFSYEIEHVLCNAHHLRELKFIEEEQGQGWAKSMSNLLLAIKKQVDYFKAHGDCAFAPSRIRVYEQCYDDILMLGLWHPDNIPKYAMDPKPGGYCKQSKAKNLLDRLRFHRDKVLAFMYDFTIPFTNNQAEQDIRMIKVKQKISGGFRSYQGAEHFMRIRSYISTAKKQGQNILLSLQNAFIGQPFIP
jgi:transposase/uncharacterized coiled-coil protein SlyX